MARRDMDAFDESLDWDLPFDPDVSFQSTRPPRNRKAVRAYFKQQNRAARSQNQTRPNETLISLKRWLDPHSATLLRSAASSALKEADPNSDGRPLLGQKIGSTLLSNSRSKYVFFNYFLSSRQDFASEIQDFNQDVSEYAAKINIERPFINVGLGEVAVFNYEKDAKSFVGVKLVGEGAAKTVDEYTGLIDYLSDKSKKGPISAFGQEPHISFLVADTLTTAECYAESLVKTIGQTRETSALDIAVLGRAK